MKRGSYKSNVGSKVKGQPSGDFLGALTFTGYLNTSWSVFLPILYTDSWWWQKDAQHLLGQTVIDQGQIKPLPESGWWLCRFWCILPGRGLYVSVLLSISDDFSLFWNIPSWPYFFDFTLLYPGVEISCRSVKTVHFDLQKSCFTEPGSNKASVLKNIAHNFYKMQKGHIIALNKIIQ